MVERVARVLAGKHWDENPAYRDHYKTLARAAIGEMREPTGDMTAAGSRQRPFNEDDTDYDSFAYRENTEGTWQAMIDAALKEEPKQ